MSITTEFRRTVDDARGVLSDPKPLHALAGVGDLVVERIRSTVAAQQAAIQSIRVEPSSVQSVVTTTVESVRGAIGELPDRTQEIVLGAAIRANHTYDDLAQRGAGLVRRIRRQKATQDLEDQVGNTVRAAKSATTTARSAASATTSRVKATATSARKAGVAAGAATEAAAAKTGRPTTTASARKPVAKKTTTKAGSTRKPTTSKTTARKTTARKTTARKTTARKTTARKTTG